MAPDSQKVWASDEEVCPKCKKSLDICVCDRTEQCKTRVKVLILQHPREKNVDIGSARVANLNLPNSKLVPGLSWGSLADAWGAPIRPTRWVVLSPLKEKEAGDNPWLLLDRNKKTIRPDKVDGIVVLDGTWEQAKTLWWRNAWLLKLGSFHLGADTPSIYGKLRKEPRKNYISTLEAIADGLTILGEDETTAEHLKRVLRTMVQRARLRPQPEKKRRPYKNRKDFRKKPASKKKASVESSDEGAVEAAPKKDSE